MNIVFMGTPDFAVPSLKILLENNYDVVSVVTIPDQKKGRGQVLSDSAVKKYALSNNLSILQPEDLKEARFLTTLKSYNPDLIIVVAFKILPEEVFTIPKFGSVNLHASLLPKYRGAAPINRALINGDSETGVTTFFIKERVDTGNIILQKKILIDENDDAGILHNKLSQLGAEAILETVRLIESGKAITVEQDNSSASTAPKIFKEDCLINWNESANKIHNQIRGLSPYPAAYTHLENKFVKIFKSKLTEFQKEGINGNIIIREKRLFASASDILLEILELQIEGKKKITSAEFINGLQKDMKIYFH